MLKTNNQKLNLTLEDLEAAMVHVEGLWPSLTRYNRHDTGTLVGLPNPYIVPSVDSGAGFKYEEMYYWDSYFTALGLLGTKHESLAYGMLDNLITLQKRFGMVPNASRLYKTGRSQPPFLTSFILELYAINKNKKWLATRMDVAKHEYREVWMGTAHPHWRQVHHDLSRYYDTNVLHNLAECESGWDMTSRFNYEALDYIPVDLNALLYKYEKDFATAAFTLGYPEEAEEWLKRAAHRKRMMDKFLWNRREGFYFDYNYKTGQQSQIWSLAGYYPLWAGMVTPTQAYQLVRNLRHFEQPGGLTATALQPQVVEKLPSQWTYPNGWAPLQYLVVKGLENYNYEAEADRLTQKWLTTNLSTFIRTGNFYEKYNVVDPLKRPKEGVYPSQVGFAWTNAIFYRLGREYLQWQPEVAPSSLRHHLQKLLPAQKRLQQVRH